MKPFTALILLQFCFGAAVVAGPAVTTGDTTTHGGTVTSGSANVRINGKPAATVGSYQSCPLVGPNGVPHVGGPVVTGSASVRINGSPAALTGSSAQCTGATTSVAGSSGNVRVN